MRTDATRFTVLSAAFTALISAGAYIAIPLGPVPMVLQNFFVLLTGLLLPPGAAVSTLFVYLFIGGLGIPVFAGGTGGVGHFFGPTGGYLLGYLPAVLVISLICGPRSELRGTPGSFRMLTALLAGSLIIYLAGVPWLAHSTGMGIPRATVVGLLPFLPGDGLKIAAALLIGRRFGPRIHRFLSGE